MEIGTNNYFNFENKFRELYKLILEGTSKTDLDKVEKDSIFEQFAKKTEIFLQGLNENNPFFIRINSFYDELETYEKNVIDIKISHLNLRKYHMNLKKLDEIEKNLNRRETDFKNWVLNNLNRLSLYDFSEGQLFRTKLTDWVKKSYNIYKQAEAIRDDIQIIYHAIYRAVSKVIGFSQNTSKTILFDDFQRQFKIFLRLSDNFLLRYPTIEKTELTNDDIVDIFEFLIDQQEVDGILNSTHKYFEFQPFQSVAPSIKRLTETVFGYLLIRIGLEHRGTLPTNDVNIHLSRLPELNFIELTPVNTNYEFTKDEIIIYKGTLYLKEKKSIFVIFEPYVCGTLNLSGYITYKSISGTSELVKMEPIRIEVVCPSFQPDIKTEKSINEIKQFFAEKSKQWRYYPIPNIPLTESEIKLDQIISSLNLIKIEAETIGEDTFEKQIWYYGITLLTNEEYVLVMEISEINQLLKLIVAGIEELNLIGILTRISDGFLKVLQMERIIEDRKEYKPLRTSVEKILFTFQELDEISKKLKYIVTTSYSSSFSKDISQDEIELMENKCEQLRDAMNKYISLNFRIMERDNEMLGYFSKLGTDLYSFIFKPEIHDAFMKLESFSEPFDKESKIRINICSFDLTLQDFPWELMKVRAEKDYLSLKHHIIRQIPLEDTILKLDYLKSTAPLSIIQRITTRFQKPIKILVVLANPLNNLDLKSELNVLLNKLDALQKKIAPGLTISVEILESPNATLNNITNKSRDAQILHFCGHGFFENESNSGLLIDITEKDLKLNKKFIIERNGNKALLLSPKLYEKLFKSNKNLKLVILNACMSARGYCNMLKTSGIAPTLIKVGIPYVIAMQFEISNDAGISFAENFYDIISKNPVIPIEDLLLEVRDALRSNQYLEPFAFLSPVLYTRLIE